MADAVEDLKRLAVGYLLALGAGVGVGLYVMGALHG